jgi:hypothetical protein
VKNYKVVVTSFGIKKEIKISRLFSTKINAKELRGKGYKQ